MFLDEARITVHGGNGGNGLVSWRREKFISRGGPWGGDGGNGGNIVVRADPNTDTLSHYAQRKDFFAEHGEHGGKARRKGKVGEDLVLLVPLGTVISDITTQEHLADLSTKGEEVTIAHGGRGGYGNAHFTSSVRQAPDFAENGEPGEQRTLLLELKLVADVGIIGFPSTGKSTLISVISESKPKIGAYPFTTLQPNLGVVNVTDRSFIACDVPGLIEGASEGKGLGDQFLRHIERCSVLVHLLDVNREDIVHDYQTIREELERYSNTLAHKRELVVLNKIDLIGNESALFEEELKINNIEIFAVISATTHHGIDTFLKKLLPVVLKEREHTQEQHKALPILRPHLESERTHEFSITEQNGAFIVHGKRIEQIVAMTDWQNDSAVRRFRDIATRIGLRDALEHAGAQNDSIIRIGNTDVSLFLAS